MDAEAALDLIFNGSDDDFSSVEELDSSEESLMSSSEEKSMDEDQNASNDSSNDEGEYQTESSSDGEDSDDEDDGVDALRGRGRGRGCGRGRGRGRGRERGRGRGRGAGQRGRGGHGARGGVRGKGRGRARGRGRGQSGGGAEEFPDGDNVGPVGTWDNEDDLDVQDPGFTPERERERGAHLRTLYVRLVKFHEVLFWPFFDRFFGQHSLARIFYSIARWKALFIHFQKIYGVRFAFPFRFRVIFDFLGLTFLHTKLMEGKGLTRSSGWACSLHVRVPRCTVFNVQLNARG